MKIKCKTTVAIAREYDRSQPHVQLYKNKVMEIDDTVALTAIELGFAVKCDAPNTNVVKEKMVEQNYQNKMMDAPPANKEIRRGRPPKNTEN